MLSKLVSSATSAALTLLYAGGMLAPNASLAAREELRQRVATEVGGMSGSVNVGRVCEWYRAPMGNNTDTACDAFSLRHGMSSQSIQTFRERAEACVVQHRVSCILSHEVGIDVPGYYYHGGDAAHVIMLPQVSRAHEYASDALLSHVLLIDPDEPHASHARVLLNLYDRVKLEYLDAYSHANVRRWASDKEAYCAQLLARSVPDECSVDHLGARAPA